MPRITEGIETKGMQAAQAIVARKGRSDEQLAVDTGVSISLIRVCKMINNKARRYIAKIARGEMSIWEAKKKIEGVEVPKAKRNK